MSSFYSDRQENRKETKHENNDKDVIVAVSGARLRTVLGSPLSALIDIHREDDFSVL